MALCFTPESASNLRYHGSGSAKLEPVRLSDGRYAYSESALTDRRFAVQRPLLKAGSVEDDSTLTFLGAEEINDVDSGVIRLTIDGHACYLSAEMAAHAFSIPATNVYRFELRKDEANWYDLANNNRRSEIGMFNSVESFAKGETVWWSSSFVIGPDHEPFDAGGTNHNALVQWKPMTFPVNGGHPVMVANLSGGNFEIYTRSDDAAPPNNKVTHYSAPRPVDGTVHNLVLTATLGEQTIDSGHITVWLDGAQIVDADTSIGHYNEPNTTEYMFTRFGMYQTNVPSPCTIYHANPEWGTADLSARISTPLAVSTPPGGWV